MVRKPGITIDTVLERIFIIKGPLEIVTLAMDTMENLNISTFKAGLTLNQEARRISTSRSLKFNR